MRVTKRRKKLRSEEEQEEGEKEEGERDGGGRYRAPTAVGAEKENIILFFFYLESYNSSKIFIRHEYLYFTNSMTVV